MNSDHELWSPTYTAVVTMHVHATRKRLLRAAAAHWLIFLQTILQAFLQGSPVHSPGDGSNCSAFKSCCRYCCCLAQTRAALLRCSLWPSLLLLACGAPCRIGAHALFTAGCRTCSMLLRFLQAVLQAALQARSCCSARTCCRVLAVPCFCLRCCQHTHYSRSHEHNSNQQRHDPDVGVCSQHLP